MKKAILLIAALLFVAQASHAYYQEFTTSDIQTLQGTGYSAETMKIVETARILRQGVEKDYVPFYSTKFYSDNPVLKYYQMARRYWDPGVNSPDFGFKEISFQNGWFDFSPSYNSKINPNDRFQRLFEDDIKRLDYTGKTIVGSGGKEEKAKEILNVSEKTPSKDSSQTKTEEQKTLMDEFILEDL